MKFVRVYADELKAQGKIVEIFDGDVIPSNAQIELAKAKITGKILDETSELYKSNESWIKKVRDEGSEILDIGNPNKIEKESIFYEMEKKITFE